MVFLNSPYRKALENVPKKKSRKRNQLVGGWLWDLANVRGGPSICFRQPLGSKQQAASSKQHKGR
jgi:hypothetical protein